MVCAPGRVDAAPPKAFFETAPAPSVSAPRFSSKRERFVTIHPEMLDSLSPSQFHPGHRPQIRLNLFDDADYTLEMDRQEIRPHGHTVFAGHLRGIPGSVGVITHRKGMMTGLFYVPGKGLFKIVPGPQGTHRVIEVDTEKASACGDDGAHPELSDPKVAADLPQEGMPGLIPLNYPAGCPNALAPTVVNLAVVYTPAALAVMGSAQAM